MIIESNRWREKLALMNDLISDFPNAQRSKAERLKSCKAVAWFFQWCRIGAKEMTDGFSFMSTQWSDLLLPAYGGVESWEVSKEMLWSWAEERTSSRDCRVGWSLWPSFAWDACLFVKGRGFPSRASKTALLKILAGGGGHEKRMVCRAHFVGRKVLWVLSNFKECEEPPNTAQEVLMAVKSENRSFILNGRVYEDLWDPAQDGVWVRESQCCRLQALSNTVTIGSQEESHSSEVNIKSDEQETKACCWVHGPGFGDQRWLECWGCTWPSRLQGTRLQPWCMFQVGSLKYLPMWDGKGGCI